MHSILSAFLLALAGSLEAGASWRGTVTVEGMIYEPGGYHPYRTTIALHLRESMRVGVAGGFRVALVSDDSIYEVHTSVHQTGGLLLCTGTGSERLTDHTVGYLETKSGKTTYHLAFPRAFGAFACGQNHSIKRDRVVIIGMGDPEPGEIETTDPNHRALEREGSVMKGAFRSQKTRESVRYEYDVRWSITRDRP